MKQFRIYLISFAVLLLMTQTIGAQVQYRIEGRFGNNDFTGQLEIVDAFENRPVDTLEVADGIIIPVEGELKEMACCVLREMNRPNGRIYSYLFIDNGTTTLEGTDRHGMLLYGGTPVSVDIMQFRRAIEQINGKWSNRQITELDSKEEKCRLTYKTISRQSQDVYGLWLLVNSGDLYLKPTQWLELDEKILPRLNERIKANAFLMKDLSDIRAKKKARVKTDKGKPFIDFSVEYQGDTVRFSDYVGRGKYVLVDFWASWCGPCRREIPKLKQIHEKYKDKGLQVLGIAVWDKPEDSLRAIEDEQMSYPQIINAQKIPTELYGINSIPEIILFAPDGTILERGLRGEEINAALWEIFSSP